jgi:hypothetical protein
MIMKQRRLARIYALPAIIVLAAAFNAAARSDDGFNWREAAREMDALPFSRAFIDSVTREHLSGPVPARQRTVRPGSFINGETLVYEVGWGPFRAGYLVLSAQHIRGRGLIRLGAKAMTTPAISSIYRLRDYSISWVDADGMYPHFFEQHVREGNRYRMDSYIVYDLNNEKLFLQRRRLQEYEAPRFTHDFLSIMYYARTLPLNPGDRFTAHMFTRPNTDLIRFRVHDRRETVTVGAGTFNCVIVEPTFVGENKAFNRRSKIEIWVTDDEHKIPVMLRSRAKIGAINARLIHMSRN